MTVSTLRLRANTHVLVLTGAGVSAESGVPTFRGQDGLWEKHPIEQVASPESFQRDPELVWRFYSERRMGAKSVSPNAGHRALAELEQRLEDRFLLATQNVDGLHTRAGSKRVVELHGNLFRTKCFGCRRAPYEDAQSYLPGNLPRCDCGSLLRPDIVWFGEFLDPANLRTVSSFFTRAQREHFVFLAAGTSGAVHPAAGFVHQAQAAGAETYLVNADPAENAGAFDHFLRGKSGELLPALFG